MGCASSRLHESKRFLIGQWVGSDEDGRHASLTINGRGDCTYVKMDLARGRPVGFPVRTNIGRWIDANTFTTGPYASCCDCCATVFTVSPPEQAGGPVTIVVDGTRLHKAPDITQGMQMVAQLQAMLAMQQPHAAPGQMQLQMQMAGGGQQDMLASWMAASGAAGASAPPYTAIPPMSK